MIGILGGSFNPVHCGHVELAKYVQKLLHFKPLWIVPSHIPPHKHPFEVRSEHRLKMLSLAFEGIPDIAISTFEMDSQRTSYAFHTIEHFQNQVQSPKDLFFILGSDAFCDLPSWYRFPKVMQACSYVVIQRKEPSYNSSQNHLKKCLRKLEADGLLFPENPKPPFEQLFTTPTKTYVCLLKAKLPQVSSTEVRERIRKGQSLEDWVPTNVERYLKSTHLYDK